MVAVPRDIHEKHALDVSGMLGAGNEKVSTPYGNVSVNAYARRGRWSQNQFGICVFVCVFGRVG